ncbi:MAG: hypothetical protein D6713_10080, partial [Deltaproteobacteria bacterium]
DIYGNEKYDVKLGNRQRENLDYSGNWWGTTDLNVIEERIFDGRDEPGLGVVAVSPVSESPWREGGGTGGN